MTISGRQTTRALRQLAPLYGVQTAYVDATGRWRQASSDALLAVLKMLGAPVSSVADTTSAWRFRHQALWQSGVAPVTVVWSHQERTLALRLPKARVNGKLLSQLTLEAGETIRWETDLLRLSVEREVEVEGVSYVTLRLPIPNTVAEGYHRLRLETAGREFATLVIVAPPRAYAPATATRRREWGVFAPLYALHSQQSWGCGDFSDLETLSRWIGKQGGHVVATLPLLAAFLDQPYEPSPYAPASRLFWNELYLDITRAPGWETCTEAQNRLSASDYQLALARCQSSDHVGYRQVMAIKRPILNLLAQHFFASSMDQSTDFQTYLQRHPEVEDYARFRAVGEHLGTPWPQWPHDLRQGTVKSGDYDEPDRLYHLYAQWASQGQLTQLTQAMQDADVQLYLDLPLGAHPHSYDVWRERESFVLEASVGAPPDSFFTKGQNWGFPPLHPDVIRHRSYRYVLAYLRHQLQHTGLLRIDHVMGLHRMFWVPQGADASQGVYVRYAADELYAILNLESHRHQVTLVGENLGTVPNYVNQAMTRHRLQQMYVAQYELSPETGLPPVPRRAVASLNTHDMPPFAAYCQGLDIDDRQQQGLLTPDGAAREHQHRQACLDALRGDTVQPAYRETANSELEELLSAGLAFLCASSAQMVLLNLEDLWLETQPQNYPGTHEERPNWQGKFRYSLEQIMQMPDVLTRLDRAQKDRARRSQR